MTAPTEAMEHTGIEAPAAADTRKSLKNWKRKERRKKAAVKRQASCVSLVSDVSLDEAFLRRTSPQTDEDTPTLLENTQKPLSVSMLIQHHNGLSRQLSISDLERSVSRQRSLEFERKKETKNPFEVTLRPTKKQNVNGKFTSESLPAIPPIKTIIGLSHQHILNIDPSDVKVKTIVQSSKVLKFAQNALSFVMNNSNGLFVDVEKKQVFFKLCLSVALYELDGFRKTTKAFPQIPEWFGSYPEINLETTRTKLTPSNKDIHQNNFDYSVLSYLGHILVWALYQQHVGKAPLFISDYDIELSQSTIRSSIGGFHLWDRLVRESKGMNSKRWKHIIKFRTSFAYEEDQFMLILKFMKVTDHVP